MSLQPPVWAGIYVGIPYRDHGADRSGCDCWGLVRLVYAQRANLILPAYANDYSDESDGNGIGRCVDVARASNVWRRVDGTPQSLDVAEMLSVVRAKRGWSYPSLHVGVVVAPGWLLHTEAVAGSRLVNLADRALGKRIAGFWRHRRLDAGD